MRGFKWLLPRILLRLFSPFYNKNLSSSEPRFVLRSASGAFQRDDPSASLRGSLCYLAVLYPIENKKLEFTLVFSCWHGACVFTYDPHPPSSLGI